MGVSESHAQPGRAHMQRSWEKKSAPLTCSGIMR